MRYSILILVFMGTLISAAKGTVVFEAGYESGLEDDGNAEIKVVEPAPDRIEASMAYARAGSWSVRSELRYGDTTDVGVRAESSTRFSGAEPIIERGVLKFYGFSVMLDPGPGNYDYDSNGDILFQVKQSSSQPSFHFMTDEGKFKFHYNNNDNPSGVTSPYFETGGYTKGIWYDFVLEFLPEYNYTGAGYFKFWYKKASESTYTLLMHYQGATLLNDKDGYIKWGIYKSTWASNPTDSTLRIVHHDNIRVATTFAEADPSGGGDPYLEWISGYGLQNSDTNMLADPDFDGMDNLYEYAIGAVPTNGSDSAAVIPTLGEHTGTAFEYIYRRRTNHVELGLSYMVECSTNLASGAWSTNGVSVSGSAPAETGFETVTNQIPTAGVDEQYMRLNISVE